VATPPHFQLLKLSSHPFPYVLATLPYQVVNVQMCPSTTGNTFYTYLPPPPATAVYSLYYVPSSIIVGSTTIPCSQSTCQITNTPNGYLMQIQNIPLSGTSVSAVVSEYMTFNPSITVPTHQTASTIPYTFYITVILPDGDTMSTSFSSAITVQSP